MIDGLIYKFFGWLDDMTKKVEDVLTFDVGQELNKKKRKKRKCKDCHCKCHCKDELHTHHWDNDICICEVCKCTKK
jgi:hypothetical protein